MNVFFYFKCQFSTDAFKKLVKKRQGKQKKTGKDIINLTVMKYIYYAIAKKTIRVLNKNVKINEYILKTKGNRNKNIK